jgi:hypothetical protein
MTRALPKFEAASVKRIGREVGGGIDIKVFPAGRMVATAATIQQLDDCRRPVRMKY